MSTCTVPSHDNVASGDSLYSPRACCKTSSTGVGRHMTSTSTPGIMASATKTAATQIYPSQGPSEHFGC